MVSTRCQPAIISNITLYLMYVENALQNILPIRIQNWQ